MTLSVPAQGSPRKQMSRLPRAPRPNALGGVSCTVSARSTNARCPVCAEKELARSEHRSLRHCRTALWERPPSPRGISLCPGKPPPLRAPRCPSRARCGHPGRAGARLFCGTSTSAYRKGGGERAHHFGVTGQTVFSPSPWMHTGESG